MSIRTVAVFHAVSGRESAWNCAEGIVETLRAMGFDAIDCQNPRYRIVDIETLKAADLIILSGLEWYAPLIRQVYGYRWLDLHMPKAAWYAESFHRDDRDFPFADTADLADIHYFPAFQDAVEFGGRWLPFGVDPSVFRPRPAQKQFDAAFIGQIYEKRRQYIETSGLSITHVRAADDPDPRRSAELLAEAYSAISTFVNLPAYSRLLVTKVTEVMACRTMLVTPVIDHPSALRNMDIFRSGRHLVYYRQERPDELRDIVNYYTSHPVERDEIAEEGWRETVRHHAMPLKIHTILDDVNARAASFRRTRADRPAPAADRDNAAAGLYFLVTSHLTQIYFDAESGEIRHTDPDSCPMNLVLEIDAAGAARLAKVEGPLLERAGVEFPQAFRIEALAGDEAALAVGGGYVSAAAGGSVQYDAAEMRAAERFRLVPARLTSLQS